MFIWPDHDFLQRLGIEHAIIQAPMAGSTTPALASAVSSAGALGSLGCAMMEPQAVMRSATALKESSNRSFNLNFFCHPEPGDDPTRAARARELVAPFYDELHAGDVPPVEASNFPFDERMLETVLDLEPQVVSFHFGLPAPELVAPLKEKGCVILSSATTAGEAKALEEQGVDAVIAQGFEAGGHRGIFEASLDAGCIGTMALVPQVVDAVKVPVIAAGGIADGRGIAAALMLGASAVQIGTAFLTCDEASTPRVHREAILSAQDADTRLTRAFSGGPARSVRNRFMDVMAEHDRALPDFPLMNTLTKPLRVASAEQDLPDAVALWAGQALTLNRSLPAAELVEALVAETEMVLASHPA